MQKTIKWLCSPIAMTGGSILLVAIGCYVTAKPSIGKPVAIILACISFILYLWAYLKLRKTNTMVENETPKTVISNSEFNTDAKKAEKATGMELNVPTQLSGVKVNLKAEDVKEVVGVRSNQGFMSMITSCVGCGQIFPAAGTGSIKSVKCPFCGKENPINR